jgi:alpha-1,6-mannosyltransferase
VSAGTSAPRQHQPASITTFTMAIIDSFLSFAIIAATIGAHLYLSPFTKVEESFNLQAIHDIYSYGIPRNSTELTQDYDHVEFPGAVPRTFVGALIVSLPLNVVRDFVSDPIQLQMCGM